jgi:hypothetical protein
VSQQGWPKIATTVQKADQPAAASLPLPNDLTEPAAEKRAEAQPEQEQQQEQQQRQDTVAHLNADGQLCYWACDIAS